MQLPQYGKQRAVQYEDDNQPHYDNYQSDVQYCRSHVKCERDKQPNHCGYQWDGQHFPYLARILQREKQQNYCDYQSDGHR